MSPSSPLGPGLVLLAVAVTVARRPGAGDASGPLSPLAVPLGVITDII